MDIFIVPGQRWDRPKGQVMTIGEIRTAEHLLPTLLKGLGMKITVHTPVPG